VLGSQLRYRREKIGCRIFESSRPHPVEDARQPCPNALRLLEDETRYTASPMRCGDGHERGHGGVETESCDHIASVEPAHRVSDQINALRARFVEDGLD